MRRWLISALFLFCAAGCSRKSARDSHNWFVESYNDGIITARRDGYAYVAKCDYGASLNNGSVGDANDWHYLPGSCGLAIGLVGHEVQPFGGQAKDTEGWTVNMWSVGDVLTVRRWRDEHTPWMQENLNITSVTLKAAQ